MSKETAMAFLKASENNSVLLEKIKAAKNLAEVVKIAAEYGYELTELEIESVKKESRVDEEDEKLSEIQLEVVAGGVQIIAGTGICEVNASVVCD